MTSFGGGSSAGGHPEHDSSGLWELVGSTPQVQGDVTPRQDQSHPGLDKEGAEDEHGGWTPHWFNPHVDIPNGGVFMPPADDGGALLPPVELPFGEHPAAMHLVDDALNLGKHPFTGTPSLEEQQSVLDRHKRARQSEGVVLPPIAEMLGGNPWESGRRTRMQPVMNFLNPVATSTPVHNTASVTVSCAATQRERTIEVDRDFYANTSGCPPTPHRAPSTCSARSGANTNHVNGDRSQAPMDLDDILFSPTRFIPSPGFPDDSPSPPPLTQPRQRVLRPTPQEPEKTSHGTGEREDGKIGTARAQNPGWRERAGVLEEGEITEARREPQGRGTTYTVGSSRVYVPDSAVQSEPGQGIRWRAPSAYVPPPTTRAAQHVRPSLGQGHFPEHGALLYHDVDERRQLQDWRGAPQSVRRMQPDRGDDLYGPTTHRDRDGATWGTPRAQRGEANGRATHLRQSLQPQTSYRSEPMEDEEGNIPEALRDWNLRAQAPRSSYGRTDDGETLSELETEDEDEEDEDGLPMCLRGGIDGEEDLPTPAPPFDAAPRVYKDAPEMFIRGLSTKWLGSMWSEQKGISLLTVVYNYDYTDDDVYTRLIATALKSAATRISGDEGIKAVPPEPKHENMRKRDAPFLWGLRGFSPEGAERMRASPFWSFKAVSFYIVDKEVRPDEWAFSLVGFLDDDAKEITRAVRGVLAEDEHIATIAKLTKRNPDFRGMREDQRVKIILGSVRVDTWTMSNNCVVANVYIRPPTRMIAKWCNWIDRLRSLKYSNYSNGTGRVRHIAHCAGCRSVNHPTHLCPFQEVAGWNGPNAGDPSFTRLPLPDLKQKPRPGPSTSRGDDQSRAGGTRGAERSWGRTLPKNRDGKQWKTPRNYAPRTPQRESRRR